MLSDRKKKILQVVIDDYITSALPVSSKSIHDSHLVDLSTATIRNELASLEELGFLSHPHTSAGRVPTKLAYKQYIDSLLQETKMTDEELMAMKGHFNSSIKEAEYIAENAVKVLSEMTNYTSIATLRNKEDTFQSIKIVKLNNNTLVLIVIENSGTVNDFKLYGNFPEGDEYVKTAENILNKHIAGRSVTDIDSLSELMVKEFSVYKDFFNQVFDALRKRLRANDNVYLIGGSKIFEQPEYNNVESVKDFLSVIDSKDKLIKMLDSNAAPSIDINVTLGGEGTDLPEDCSMVSAKCYIDDVDFGTFGVIGPVRMDYNKVIKVLNGIRDILNDIVNDK
ncbi:MAG: heat-inducible transcriptional repressor HrcA [Clostridia bacterium]